MTVMTSLNEFYSSHKLKILEIVFNNLSTTEILKVLLPPQQSLLVRVIPTILALHKALSNSQSFATINNQCNVHIKQG